MSSSTTTTNTPTRNAESPRSRHNIASTMATTPAFAFMGQGTSSATVAARVTPAAASGTTAAPSTTTMTTVTSAAAAGVAATSSSTTTTVPTWTNGTSAAVTTAVPATGVPAPFSGLIFGAPATGTLALPSATTAVTGGGTATPLFAAGGTTTIPSGSGSATGQTPAVPTTTTTTHTAGRFTPARLGDTASNLWGTNVSTNATNLFGNQAASMRLGSAGTPPGPGRFFNNFATRPSLALATTQPATTSTSIFTPSFTSQAPQLQCTKEIRFRFEWAPENISILLGIGLTQQFRVREGDVDTLQCSLLQTPDTFKMTLEFATNHKGNNQSWLQTLSVFTVDQKRLTSTAVFWPSARQFHCSWPKSETTLVKNAEGRYGVDVLLSSEKSGVKFNPTTSTTYTDHCDSILGKMLDDPSSYDVFFEFDPPESFSESEVEIGASDSETGFVEKIEIEDEGYQQEDDGNVGVREFKTTFADRTERSIKEPGEPSSTPLLDTKSTAEPTDGVDRGHDKDRGRDRGLQWPLDKVDLHDEEAYVDAFDAKVMTGAEHVYTALDNTSNALITPPTTTKSRTPIVETLGAHKLVLSQYEYFKTMFSSSFAEGGPGIKRIKIKDSDIHCFRLLIQFLYLGRLRLWNAPTVLTQDCPMVKHQPSWEDVYLIADRYSIAELKEMAGTRIIQGLSSEWAVPFLFRTGYLFEEMRHALIKYVVKNNMDEISHKKTQEAYFSHPECTAIFGEIIAELWTSKSFH
ncbi:hypothetical protein BG015_007930 [Linnemannia schmuckeri]|uniref:BTB domain-containing protein n=1 Tax=Linnemannia schmuckeri TaxID=64567 RepID=A0A9P5S0F4_9FUNG|nr:hypothetical protein BG015_007930 [Linnemannia schmuckeri]